MNPLKWKVWIRIAGVASILWIIGGFSAWIGKAEYDRLSSDDITSFLFPLVIFWGIAWIVHGTSIPKDLVRGIKSPRVWVLIGIVVIAIVVVFVLFGKKAEEVKIETPDSALAPPGSKGLGPLLEMPPSYQQLPKSGGDSRR